MTWIDGDDGSRIELASAGRALGDASEGYESGDFHVATSFDGGFLVAAIDGLGHGTEAAVASRAAAEVLEAHAGESISLLVQRCHERLRKTRGAAMSLARLNVRDSSMIWGGIGDVEAVLVRSDSLADRRMEHIGLRGGVVGYVMPSVKETGIDVSTGDTLIMATDGIASRFADDLSIGSTPQMIAESILARHGRDNDDALVVVARYFGAMS
jgi:serine phosphatase RsbU (regulator of sigma subunit)